MGFLWRLWICGFFFLILFPSFVKLKKNKNQKPKGSWPSDRPGRREAPVWAPAWGCGCQVSPPWVTLLPLCTLCFWKEVTMHSSHWRSGELQSTSFKEQWRLILLFMRCNATLEIKQQRRMHACLMLSVYNACFPLLVAWTTWDALLTSGAQRQSHGSVSDGLEGPQTLRVRSP